MKKILFLLGTCGILAGGFFYLHETNYEIAAVMDQLNPLVKESAIYVKIPQPKRVDEHGAAYYEQTGYTPEGKKFFVKYMGMTTLKEDHYLKLTSKGKHIENYEEVSFLDLPQGVQEKIA